MALQKDIKVAFVNPPFKAIIIREYYCPHIAKSSYCYPPIDFIWLSAGIEYPLKVIDAIAEKLDAQQTINRVCSFNPTHIFVLVSSISLHSDLDFMKKLKVASQAKIVVLGDVCRLFPDEVLSLSPEIDVVLTSFVVPHISSAIYSDFRGYNENEKLWITRSTEADTKKDVPNTSFQIGVPKWQYFLSDKYIFPFVRKKPAATILTDYGCAYSCSFCPNGAIQWQKRVVNEVLEEIDLIASLGIGEIHFKDLTFGVDTSRTSALLAKLKECGISWSCLSRVDTVNEDSLRNIKNSGCHTVIFGLESGSNSVRKKYGKYILNSDIMKILNFCQHIKLDTVGTFIIGYGEETEEDVMNTIRFALNLPLSYASFNIGMTNPITKNDLMCLAHNDDIHVCYSWDKSRKALDFVSLANKMYYMRPLQIVRRITSYKSLSAFLSEARLGYNLLFN